MNNLLQGIAVGIILIICIVWVPRRIFHRRKHPTCHCGCSSSASCPIADACKSKDKDKNTN